MECIINALLICLSQLVVSGFCRVALILDNYIGAGDKVNGDVIGSVNKLIMCFNGFILSFTKNSPCTESL